MANIINQILDIDKLAVDKLNIANKQKQDAIQQIKQTTDIVNKELLDKANSRIEKVCEIERSYAQSKMDNIKSHNDKVISSLEENFNNNHQRWEDEIVSNIIG